MSIADVFMEKAITNATNELPAGAHRGYLHGPLPSSRHLSTNPEAAREARGFRQAIHWAEMKEKLSRDVREKNTFTHTHTHTSTIYVLFPRFYRFYDFQVYFIFMLFFSGLFIV